MSWLFGLIDNDLKQKDVESSIVIHGTSLQAFTDKKKYYVATGGNNKTCFATEKYQSNSNFWIALGCIFQNTASKSKICQQSDWQNISTNIDILGNHNGHYVFLSFKENRFEIRTDALGLRTFYWSKKDNKIIFSTRLDWITKFLNGGSLNYQTIGSRWLLFNQLSYTSLVNNIHRLGPNGKITISDNNVVRSEQAFLPSFSKKFSYDEAVTLIEDFLYPKLEKNLQMSLGLSGGLDSRVLLSLLLKSKNKNFCTHTFGNLLEADVFIPNKISQQENFLHIAYNNPLPSVDKLIPLLNNYIAETNLVEPVSTILRLRNYSELNAKKFILVDGGFGEIARRQYLNRLALKGKKSIQGKNIDSILNNLRITRANIFTQDILNQMEFGVKNEVEYMFNTMPDICDIGLENYLDLWAIRTRLPNFGADEQARLDSFILNFMPFAQKDFINMVFAMPIKLRQNGKFFKSLIRESFPHLATYPLVKNNITYPFALSTKSAWLLTKIKSKFTTVYSEDHIHVFLNMLKGFIFDLLLSQNTKEYSAYNYQHIKTSIENYYSGNQSLSNDVNWWLTFELWRRNIEVKNTLIF